MTDQKITELTEITALDTDDEFIVADTDAAVSKKITAGALGVVSGQVIVEEIHNETLGAAGRFDVSSIPATYDHLEMHFWGRSDVAAVEDRISFILNNDTTAGNYFTQYRGYYNGTSKFGTEAATYGLGNISGNTAVANSFSYNHIWIPYYTRTDFKKIVSSRGAVEQGTGLVLNMATTLLWISTAAINQITVQPDGYATDEFLAGSTLQILGWKTL